MITRRHGFGLGTALSLASLCLSFTRPALAQDPVPPPAADAATKPADAPPADAPAGTPAAEPTKEPEKAAEQDKAPEPTPPPEAPKTASGTSVEREKSVSLIGIELLPGSAYPSTPTRGIKYGSM